MFVSVLGAPLRVVSCVLLLAACHRPLPPPKVPAPEVVAREDPLPPLPASTLSLALGVDLRALEPLLTELINTELPLRQPDWTRVTKEGANPQVETRMQARVDKLTLAVKDNVLRIAARIDYWGKVRAQVSTPFGKAWLTHGTDWGTEKAPGSVHLTLDLAPSLTRSFALKTRTTLERVSFEAPKGDALCGRMLIKVCVPREQAAKEVHAALKREVDAAAPHFLAEVDRRVSRMTDVPSVVALALRTWEHTTPAIDDMSLKLSIEQVALGQLQGNGARASLPLELTLRAMFGGRHVDTERELPKRRDPEGLATDLTFDTRLTFRKLSDALQTELLGFEQGAFSLAKIEVLGVGKGSDRLLLALTLMREDESFVLYAEAVPQVAGERLVLSAVQLTSASKRAARLLALDDHALTALLTHKGVSLSELAERYLAALSSKVQAPLVLFGTLSLRFETAPRFETFYARDGWVIRMQGRAESELR